MPGTESGLPLIPSVKIEVKHGGMIRPKKSVFMVRRLTLTFGPTVNFFMALLVENYLNTLFLPSNVVFYV